MPCEIGQQWNSLRFSWSQGSAICVDPFFERDSLRVQIPDTVPFVQRNVYLAFPLLQGLDVAIAHSTFEA